MAILADLDLTEAKNKSICVWDIPLNTNKQEIKQKLAQFGQIKRFKMNTAGMWQSAQVEFAEQEDYEKMSTRWSIPFKGELLRIYPLLKTFEVKQTQDKYTLRLTNLPPGTTGYNLRDIISTTKAASCHIPRNRNYTKKRFAFLNFTSAEAKAQAKNQKVHLGETPLNWHEVEEKLCAICSAADHLAAQCTIKARRQEKQQML